MPEEIKERLSKTEYEVDIEKIDFDSIPLREQNKDSGSYKIKTGMIPIELLKV